MGIRFFILFKTLGGIMIKKTNSCPACKGDGYIVCTSCKGSGKMKKGTISSSKGRKDDIGACPFCNGKGKIRCTSCNGTGEK